jgi:hypothetical protein
MKIGQLQLFEREVIGGKENPLLVRYKIVKCPLFGLCVHKLCRSDYDRALHDHPWAFLSIVLRNGYDEVHDQTYENTVTRVSHRPGALLFRPARWRHRVVIRDGRPAWTLVLMGPRVRRWGFWLPEGWCWWRKHNHDLAICEDEPIWTGSGD